MLKKTITYKDFNDLERTEDFYFNLSKSELVEMETTTVGGMSTIITKIINAKDQPEIMKLLKHIIVLSYGEKSADGRFFDKSEVISNRFIHSNAYDVLFQELFTSEENAAAFIQGIIPELTAAEKAEIEKQKVLLNN